jgi:hypothetical protein
MNILTLEVAAFQMGPQRQNGDFVEYICNGFDKISVIHWLHLPKLNSIGGTFRIVTARAPGPHT